MAKMSRQRIALCGYSWRLSGVVSWSACSRYTVPSRVFEIVLNFCLARRYRIVGVYHGVPDAFTPGDKRERSRGRRLQTARRAFYLYG